MPRTGTSSPSLRRTEHSDRENSDEEDVLLPNVRDGLNNAEPGMDEYSEGKNESDHSFTEGKSSSSDGDSSFVGKIRSNFSGMISALLPARQSKQSGGLPPARKPSERRFEARNIGNEQFEGQSSIELRKRPLSPNLVEIDVDNRTYETIKKRPRLRESADTKEEERSIRPTSATLGTQTASSSSSHRLSGLMSNATYRRRMQQSRGGYVHKTLFGSSHLKSTKNRNDSVASSGRPSFNISVAKMAKTLSNGWIPPEYGGSPFYEGLTRFGGASSAHTLATPGPSRPPVTVLVKKSHPTVKAQSLPDPLEELKPETHASAMSYSSRRILEIVNEYSARSSSSKRGMSLSNVDLRTPRTLQMLNLIRSQQMERSEEPPEQPARPPTVPLMEYSLPLHVDSSNSPDAARKEEAKSSGGKQITKKTRLHADPIKERDDSTVEPIQLPNLKLPPLEGLPKFDFTVPMKGPLLPADKKGGMNSDKLPESDEKKKGEDKAKDTRTPTTTIRSEIRSFGFTSPMPLASSSKVTDPVTAVVSESSIPLTREVTTFVFTSPKLLNGSSQSANPAPTVSNEAPSLHCEKHTFVFVTPLMLDSPTVHTEPVSATIMSFEFTSPEPLEVIAPKVRSFQELMAESASKWACDVCMIRNEPTHQKCIACESPKPGPLEVSNAPKVRSFQELMAESASKWTCDVCMIRNEPTHQKCIACESPKPVAVSAKKTEPFLPAAGNFQELMAESASKWACDVCMIRNEPTHQKCIACESPKPVAVPAKKTQPFLPTAGGNITITTSGSFAAIVNAQSSRWECSACSVRNEPTATVCVCCATENPAGTTK